MPLLVAEALVVGRGLVAAEFGADRGVDHFGQVVRDLNVRAKAEEHVSPLAGRVLLAPRAAIAERRNGADAIVERDALLAVRLVRQALAGRLADLDIGERQVVAVEQLCDLGRCRQRLAFGTAVVDGLGAQALNARPKLVERVSAHLARRP